MLLRIKQIKGKFTANVTVYKHNQNTVAHTTSIQQNKSRNIVIKLKNTQNKMLSL